MSAVTRNVRAEISTKAGVNLPIIRLETTRLLCIGLIVQNLVLLPQTRADQPTQYVWQIERLDQAANAYCLNGFQGGDVASVFLDIPSQFFPLRVDQVHLWWSPPPGVTAHPLAARVYFWEGSTGALKYVLDGVALMPGKNIVRLAVECQECLVVFDEDDGPGLAIGVQYLTEFELPVNPNSGHVVIGDDGCWPGSSLVYDYLQDEWVDICPLGADGNFGIRAEFATLCPDRVGDMDGDRDIDLRDYALLQSSFTGEGVDAFAGPEIYADLDNDHDVDSEDLAVLVGHVTGPAVQVDCPTVDIQPENPGTSHLVTVDDPAAMGIPENLWQWPTTVEPTALRFTYVEALITLSFIAVLALLIGPCITASCRAGAAVDFATDGSLPNTTEADRFRAAIDRIGQFNDELSQDCYFFLAQSGWYNPEVFGLIRINRLVSEDDTAYGATHVLGRMTIHNSFITGDRWALYGVDGLALLLFAEWQHMNHPTWTENQCQEELMEWREDVGFEEVGPEFGHGFGD